MTLTKICVGEIELHIIGIGVSLQRHLKMLDRLVVQTISRQENTDACLCAIVIRADLIELSERIPREFKLPKLQIRFRQEVQIFRLSMIFLDLCRKFRYIELRTLLGRKCRAVVEIVEEVLIWLRVDGCVLR